MAKSAFIFSDERSFFTLFVPLPSLDHIPFDLLSFGLIEIRDVLLKMRALACLDFETLLDETCPSVYSKYHGI